MFVDYTKPVLVVDDQPLMVGLTHKILSRIGFEHIDHTRDGGEALGLLRQRSYQLVISDLHMGRVSGLDLLRSVRKDKELDRIPFLLMTGSVHTGAAVVAKQAGADAYLLKPFTPEQLRAKLQEIFSRTRH